MDVLTDHEIAMILQRLEALATALEHAASVRTFYTFVLTAQAFAETKHALSALAHLRRCLALAHRMRATYRKFKRLFPRPPLPACHPAVGAACPDERRASAQARCRGGAAERR